MSRVNARGQVAIPEDIRDYLGIGPGSEVRFRRAADGSVIVEPIAASKPPSRFAKLLGHAGEGPSTDEIMALTRGEQQVACVGSDEILHSCSIAIGGLRTPSRGI